MADVTFDVAPTTPRKRSREEAEGNDNELCEGTIVVNTTLGDHVATRDTSPAPSTSSSLTELTTSIEPGSAVKSTHSATQSLPSKKRKLGFIEAQAEKAAKKQEKEDKAKQKAEEKMKKDEEKRKVAEEKEAAKLARELEKAEKQKIKDEEKEKRDAEKAMKDAEKGRKDAERRAKEAEKESEKLRKEADKLKKERVSSGISRE